MNEKRNFEVRLIARFLDGEVPVVGSVAIVAVASCVVSFKLIEHEYVRECLVELSVGSAFFLALIFANAEKKKLTIPFALAILFGGGLLGVSGYFVQERAPLIAAYLLKFASAIVLFVLVERFIRGLLHRAAEKRGAWETDVQKLREAVIAKVKTAGGDVADRVVDAAVVAVMVGGAAVGSAAGIKIEYEDEEGRRHPMEGPDLPEPLITFSEIPWSYSMFGRTSDAEE